MKNPPLVSRRPVATVEESTGLRDGRFSRDTTDRSSRHTQPLASRLPGHRRALPGSQGGHPRASPAPPPLLPSELLFRQHIPPAPGPTGNSPGVTAAGQRTWSRAPSSPKPPSLSSCHCSPGAFGARRELPDPTRIRRGRQAGRLIVQPLLLESGWGGGVSACLATKRPGYTDAPGML